MIKLDPHSESILQEYREHLPLFLETEKQIANTLRKYLSEAGIRIALQYSNAIFVGDRHYFIDLGDFCWGNHLFDVAMVYLCCCLSDEAFIKETFHMPKALAIRFWECFAPAYFGEGIPLKEITEVILPFAGLKTLIVERDSKRPMPEFRAALKSIL